jgi:hypothetical protein
MVACNPVGGIFGPALSGVLMRFLVVRIKLEEPIVSLVTTLEAFEPIIFNYLVKSFYVALSLMVKMEFFSLSDS